MSSLTNSTASVSAASRSRIGCTAWHGPHHGAQKSTTTGLPACSTSCSKLASVTSRTAVPIYRRSLYRGRHVLTSPKQFPNVALIRPGRPYSEDVPTRQRRGGTHAPETHDPARRRGAHADACAAGGGRPRQTGQGAQAAV